jgi:hypothetical protein
MKKNTNNNAERAGTYGQKESKEQADNIMKVWKVNREFRLQDIGFEDYEKIYDELDGLLKTIDSRSRELNELKVAQTKLVARLGPLNTRARNGMRGYFGSQSSEFAGVKVHQSHKAVRKAKNPAPAESEAAVLNGPWQVHKASKPAPAESDAAAPLVPWKYRTVRKPAGEKSAAPATPPPPAIPAPASEPTAV